MKEDAEKFLERAAKAATGRIVAFIHKNTEKGDLECAADYFRRAVRIELDNLLALFNLGSTLDDLGLLPEARQHLRLATRLDPNYADAHYNLAIVCDKMNAESEARAHWTAYIKLDPAGADAESARKHLT